MKLNGGEKIEIRCLVGFGDGDHLLISQTVVSKEAKLKKKLVTGEIYLKLVVPLEK